MLSNAVCLFMCVLRALGDKADMAEANHRLKQTRTLVSSLLPQVSTLKSAVRFLSRSSAPELSVEQLELTLIQAESYLLQAFLLFTEESYLCYVKAGLKIRSAWKLYERCENQIAAYTPEVREKIDPSVLGGVRFGIGAFNLTISILPSIVLRVVSALGFPSDRTRGLELVAECARTPGVRQPLACLELLFVHIIIPSFFTVRPGYHASEASLILDDWCWEKYPNGALFLWMAGRLERMRRDLPAATQAFERSAAGQPTWIQLQHLCAYELGFCSFFSLNFTKSAAYWLRLREENNWSKAFFAYMHAVSTMCQGGKLTHDGASASSSASSSSDSSSSSSSTSPSSDPSSYLPLFGSVDSFISRKFGGRIISIEQFVSQRSKRIVELMKGDKPPRMPALIQVEMIYLFSGLVQMPDTLLLRVLRHADETIEAGTKGDSPSLPREELSLCYLVRSVTLKALRRYAEARSLLQGFTRHLRITHASNHVSNESILQNSAYAYVAPFAWFELGALIMEQIVEKDAAVNAAAEGKGPVAACSIDQPLKDATFDEHFVATFPSPTDPTSSSSSTPSSDWESDRQIHLDQAHAHLKHAESYRNDYHFKNRLHLRIHLACVEIKMMRKHWESLQGNVQSEAELKDGMTDANQEAKVVDSDEEGEEEKAE